MFCRHGDSRGVQLLGLLAIQVVFLWQRVGAYTNGVPLSACLDMTPRVHGTRVAGLGDSPYSLSISRDTWGDSLEVQVRVEGGDYKGILMQARVKKTGQVVGHFTELHSGTRTKNCYDSLDTVTHSDGEEKGSGVVYTWVGPTSNVGSVEFVATIVEKKKKWWTFVKSGTLKYVHAEGGSLTNTEITYISVIAVVVAIMIIIGIYFGVTTA